MDQYLSYAPADVLRTKDETFKKVFSGKLIFSVDTQTEFVNFNIDWKEMCSDLNQSGLKTFVFL